MIKYFGTMIDETTMRVDVISYSGNRPGGVEVAEEIDGVGQLFVNVETLEQWRVVGAEPCNEEVVPNGGLVGKLATAIEEVVDANPTLTLTDGICANCIHHDEHIDLVNGEYYPDGCFCHHEEGKLIHKAHDCELEGHGVQECPYKVTADES